MFSKPIWLYTHYTKQNNDVFILKCVYVLKSYKLNKLLCSVFHRCLIFLLHHNYKDETFLVKEIEGLEDLFKKVYILVEIEKLEFFEWKSIIIASKHFRITWVSLEQCNKRSHQAACFLFKESFFHIYNDMSKGE